LSEAQPRMRYALVARVPRSVEVRIEDLFLHIAGSTKSNMGYHITLVGPFFMANDRDHRSLAGIAETCRRWRPFTVYLGGLGTYISPDNNAVYLHITDPAPISALNHDLTLALNGQIESQFVCEPESDRAGYRPHVTLALSLTDRELDEFLRVGSDELTGVSFQIDDLWLVQEMGGGSWRYLQCYPLGAEAQDAPPGIDRTY
jgi:2'-5' RNA ligase